MNTDRAIHEMLAGLENVRWRETMFEDLDWYYAEDGVYVLRCKHGTPNEHLLVVRAKSPDEAMGQGLFGRFPIQEQFYLLQ